MSRDQFDNGFTAQREKEMHEAFWQRARKILKNPDRFLKNQCTLRAGFEMEYSLMDKELKPVSESSRDELVQTHKRAHEQVRKEYKNFSFLDGELGAFQLELRTPPHNLSELGITELGKILSDLENVLKEISSASNMNLLRIGSNPLIPISEIPLSISQEKFRLVPNYHNQHKRWDIDTMMGTNDSVNVQDAAVVALFNASQCNIEAYNINDAVDKLNRSLMIGPYIMALCCNSRFLDYKDTGLSDLRMVAWEISHDVRTSREVRRGDSLRVGFPGSYYVDLEDYFNRTASYPFILYQPENAFEVGMGLNWGDSRIKFVDNSCVVEFRLIPMQPTMEEDLAWIIFYLGRLTWSHRRREPLIDSGLVRENRYEVMEKGLKGKLWHRAQGNLRRSDADMAIKYELQRAKEGVKMLDLMDTTAKRCFSILENRLIKGAPVDQFAELVRGYVKNKCPMDHALVLAMNDLGILK